ncbi:hypothetical protein ASPWEDRAFT_139929 [Aspergillus wentii DTO 134E9]|uniref:Arylsulfatase n=1 Tax=Aspergillus wentii DTO 134E9 TaxID=1073089 RepID=A0A1L9RBJ3_ASPWE|nr:uncharacterized protein ASPWEDRAFT_139929 [Aspergillus wentii DTO 134E9]OJJ32243.1 hypothetical protein ASPWEDRAFT_139929 [Aspergillus wentii DTO 134E9]
MLFHSFAWLAVAVGAIAASGSRNETAKPNFIVIVTDDQDLRMNSLDYMPRAKKYLTDEGTFFNHHYATVALCCPARASLWTGKAAHNTNITNLGPPYGGFKKFIDEGYNEKWLPVWMKNGGYETYFTGKLMNGHDTKNYDLQLKNMGLTGHDFFIEPGTYQYWNTTVQHNLDKPKSYPGEFATDLLANKSMKWIDDAVKKEKPFFLAMNPVNPHGNYDYKTGKFTPPLPKDKYKNAFPDAKVPRNVSFNPDQPSGASWIRELRQLNSSVIEENDEFYRARLQALQSIDDLIETAIETLKKHNILDNTYIIYTSDNGFHISQHRLTPGKRCPYEEDVNVPLIIRGPGIPKGQTSDLVTSHLDIAPSIVKWAGAKGPGDFDGAAIPKSGKADPNEPWEHVEVEHWGTVSAKQYVALRNRVNTYKAVRVIGKGYNIFYSVWCEGDHEVYDMTNDPHQMKNLYNSTSKILNTPMSKVQHRLDALTLVLKACKGRTCQKPWEALHPDGKVKTLVEALDSKYDSFYKNQHRVSFDHCALGYIVANELPIKYAKYGNESSTHDERGLEGWNIFP